MKIEKEHLGYLFREIVIVVVGVLIAVSINNYKEKLDNESYMQKTLLAIDNEIKLSQSQVDTVLKKHLKVVEYFENNYDNNSKSLGEELLNIGGIQAPSIKNISLRFFIANKAELLTFEVISQLSDIESFKNTLTEKLTRMIDFTYEHMDEKGEDAKIKFTYHLANVIDSEQALLQLYSEFLKTNGAYLQQKSQLE